MTVAPQIFCYVIYHLAMFYNELDKEVKLSPQRYDKDNLDKIANILVNILLLNSYYDTFYVFTYQNLIDCH